MIYFIRIFGFGFSLLAQTKGEDLHLLHLEPKKTESLQLLQHTELELSTKGEAAVWLSLEGKDYILQAGERLRLEGKGLLVIEPLGAQALLTARIF